MICNEEARKKHAFTWKIENFSMCCKKKGNCILSPIFAAKSLYGTAWCLHLYPRGDNKSDDGYISFYLLAVVQGFLEIECDYIIEFFDKNEHIVLCSKGTHNFKRGSKLGWRNFIKRDDFLKTALYDDIVVIRCTLNGKIPEKNFFSQNAGSTKFQINTFSFQWTVKKLDSITHQEVIKFPYPETHAEITIQFPEDDVKIYIQVGGFTNPQFLSCTFILLDVHGNKRGSKQAAHLFESSERWEFPTFIKKSQLYAEKAVYIKRRVFDGDCFRFQCEISASDGSVVEDIEDEDKGKLLLNEELTVSAIDTFATLSNDLKQLYADKIHTEVKLKTGEKVFPAHKSILCARSPVFLAMFDSDMIEAQNCEVDIQDLEAETMGLFLEYIYTGTVSDFDHEKALKLILAADKYQVLSLKDKCAELLTSVLSEANVCEILAIADMVQQGILKASAINYIKTHPKKIFSSEKWKVCVKNNIELATETVCKVSTFLGDQAKEHSGK